MRIFGGLFRRVTSCTIEGQEAIAAWTCPEAGMLQSCG